MKFSPLLSCAALLSSMSLTAEEPAWKPLWNGKDLTGWDTYLAKPHASVKLPQEERDEKGEHTGPVGLNNDPLNVFTIVENEGKPAIRASGEIYGTITTKESFSNYHLRLEMKWGEKKWEPRLERLRDAGLLYHAEGEWGTVGAWLPSLELQIQETDLGDFWAVNSRAQIRSKPAEDGLFIFDAGSEPRLFSMRAPGSDAPRRCLKGADHEKPHGEWNRVELVCLGDKAWHVVNGHVVLIAETCERLDKGTWVPATSGRIQVQSEGAEVFYRNIELRPVTRLPEQFETEQK